MEFTTVKGHPRYEISRNGTIRNRENLKIKSQYVGSTGYYMVSFSYNNKSKPQRVHRLLATTFKPNPENKPNINHLDGNKLNNDLNNLEWCTHAENMRHAFRTGLANNTGIKNGMAKLNPASARKIKQLLSEGVSQQKIADQFNVSRSCILKINLNKTWKHVAQ